MLKAKAKVARKPFIQMLKEAWTDHKEYSAWSKIDTYSDKLTRKEKELQYLRTKGAAIEAKANMLDENASAKAVSSAQDLINYYENEICIGSSASHVSMATRVAGVAILLMAEILLWTLMMYLPLADIMPGAMQAFYAMGCLLAIALVCDLVAFRLFGKICDCVLRHRNKKLRNYISAITFSN